MKTFLLIVSLGGMLLAAIWGAVELMLSLQGVEIGFHGRLALFLGIFFSALIGCGLMALTFYSARNGYDQ